MVKPVCWQGALTLGELVYKMVHEKKMDSEEFKALVKYFGLEKLRLIYQDERRKRKTP